MFILEWIKDTGHLLVWPVVVLIIVLFLMFSKNGAKRISEIFKGFKSVKMFGAEFVLTDEIAKEVSQNAHDTFQTYRKQAKVEYKRLVDVYDLRAKMEQVISSIRLENQTELKKVKNLRCTIHIPDVIFSDTMCQLMDYYPAGGGRGRIWSFRYGIIGKSWRLGNSETEECVSTDEEWLIKEWGMTRAEATVARGKQSCSSVILRDENNTAVGIYYMDSTEKDAFSKLDDRGQEQFHDKISTACMQCGLTTSVAKLRRELLAGGSLIDIYG